MPLGQAITARTGRPRWGIHHARGFEPPTSASWSSRGPLLPRRLGVGTSGHSPREVAVVPRVRPEDWESQASVSGVFRHSVGIVPYMAYSPSVRDSRRCKATTRHGLPCGAFAMWDSPHKLCLVHSGLGHHGPQPWWRPSTHVSARYPPCRCQAYAWPHRPGGGTCIWPEGLVRLAAERLVASKLAARAVQRVELFQEHPPGPG